jgi:hypothetical protein
MGHYSRADPARIPAARNTQPQPKTAQRVPILVDSDAFAANDRKQMPTKESMGRYTR